MKRLIVGMVICSVAGLPVRAEEIGRKDPEVVSGEARGGPLNLQAIVADKASIIAALQVPQTQQPPPPPAPGPTGPRVTKSQKTLYWITLAGAAAGVIYNISTTRDALDHHLETRTFPLVWKKTSDPSDKNSVTGIIAGTNGGLLAIGAYIFAGGRAQPATFVNLLVGVGTAVTGLRNRSTINDCVSAGTCR
jgi:hypothetical protein